MKDGALKLASAAQPAPVPVPDWKDGVMEQQAETISEKQAHAMAQVCLDLHDALGCKWGDNPYLTISQLKAAAQPAPVQEPVGEKEISAWAERHDIQGTPTDLRSMFEDAASFTTPPAAQRKPLTDEQRQELMSKAWNEWLSRKDDGRLFAWSFSFEVEAAHGIKEIT
jgi:hypothetical protein